MIQEQVTCRRGWDMGISRAQVQITVIASFVLVGLGAVTARQVDHQVSTRVCAFCVRVPARGLRSDAQPRRLAA